MFNESGYEMKTEEIRKTVYDIIEAAREGDTASRAYDLFMIVSVVISLIPLAYKKAPSYFTAIEILVTIIYIADY